MCLFTVFSFIFIGQIAANDASLVYRLARSSSLLQINQRDGYDVHVDLLQGGALHRYRRQLPVPSLPIGDNSSITFPSNETVANVTVSPNVTIPAVKATTTPAPITTQKLTPKTKKPMTTQFPTKKPTDPVSGVNITEHGGNYYNQTTITQDTPQAWKWKDLTGSGVRHITLSDGHRLAQTVPLKFNFQFYGHIVTNVTIATGGFLYMSPFLHKFLTATQYIAPLMANFDTTLGNESYVSFLTTKDIFVVQWENVHLQDQVTVGRFNFQVHLKKQGEILFLYKDVPVKISDIVKKNHPVKIGLSDAFYIDKDVPKLGLKRRTIFEYHRVAVNMENIRNYTVIMLVPQKTCNMATTCDSCLELDEGLGCKWCGVVGKCSDGIDWYRQHWLEQGCAYLSGNVNCSIIVDTHPSTNSPRTSKADGGQSNINPGWVIMIIVVLAILIGVGGWFFYAYTHPTTSSGMWLMEHRPTAMKTKLAKMTFWKRNTPTGEKYSVESEA